jgi:hypothetical protein
MPVTQNDEPIRNLGIGLKKEQEVDSSFCVKMVCMAMLLLVNNKDLLGRWVNAF